MAEPSWEQFKTSGRLRVDDAKKLIGKRVWYMCSTDIDKTGRGYYFPRFIIPVKYQGRCLISKQGNEVQVSEIKMIYIEPEEAISGTSR